MRFQANIDFDFQSSQSGGRLELGGIVVDFLFPIMMMCIQVQGPTHTEYLRSQKDREQRMTLAEMGYDVYEIDEDEIYDVNRMWDKLRRIFNIAQGGGSGQTVSTESDRDTESVTKQDWSESMQLADTIRQSLLELYPR